MGLNSVAALIPGYNFSANKFAKALLDGGPSMLKRGLIAGAMDWVWFHIFLVYMVMLVDLLPIHVAILLSSTNRVSAFGQPMLHTTIHTPCLRMSDLFPYVSSSFLVYE